MRVATVGIRIDAGSDKASAVGEDKIQWPRIGSVTSRTSLSVIGFLVNLYIGEDLPQAFLFFPLINNARSQFG